jgi:hypothetical protein
MNRRLILGLAAAITLAACSEEATNTTEVPQNPDLILYGTPDGNAHPYVGFLIFFNAQNQPLWLCTGTLLDRNTVLTAGHCVFGAAKARFYPEEKPLGPGILTRGYIGTPIPYPGYDEFATFPNTGDIGVVQLDGAGLPGPYARLAPLNSLDQLSKHGIFELVGYGDEDVRPVEVFNGERMRAEAKLVNAKSGFSGGFNLHLSSNNGRPHRGGLCFGDSGGPVLLGDVVYAVNSFVANRNCTGSGYSYRVDLDPVHAWIVMQRNA